MCLFIDVPSGAELLRTRRDGTPVICPIKLLIATQRTVNVMASGAEWQRFCTSPLPRDSATTNATNGSPSLRKIRRHFGNCRRRDWGHHRDEEAQAQKMMKKMMPRHEELKSTIDKLKARTERAIVCEAAAAEQKMKEEKSDYARTVQKCQDKLVNGKKQESDSPPREKPTVESAEAARAKLAVRAVRIQQKCFNVNQGSTRL